MKLAVVGSRNIDDAGFIEQKLDELLASLRIKTIVSGGAQGVDLIAEKWAIANYIETLIIKPDYQKYASKVAPLKRNEEIVKACDLLIAFWDGKSLSTTYTVTQARKVNKLFKVFYHNPKSGWLEI